MMKKVIRPVLASRLNNYDDVLDSITEDMDEERVS